MKIKYNRVRVNAIDIEMSNKSRKIERIPNDLLWAVNGFLADRFTLYEYCKGFRNHSTTSDSIPLINILFRQIFIKPLDTCYVKRRHLPMDELHEEFCSISDDITFEEFKEIAELETINGLSYFACFELHSLLNEITTKKYRIVTFNQLTQLINDIMPVSVSVGDHDTMSIIVNQEKLIPDVIDIIKKFV